MDITNLHGLKSTLEDYKQMSEHLINAFDKYLNLSVGDDYEQARLISDIFAFAKDSKYSLSAKLLGTVITIRAEIIWNGDGNHCEGQLAAYQKFEGLKEENQLAVLYFDRNGNVTDKANKTIKDELIAEHLFNETFSNDIIFRPGNSDTEPLPKKNTVKEDVAILAGLAAGKTKRQII